MCRLLSRCELLSRADVKGIAGLPRDAKGGIWDTGVVEHQTEFLIFANVGAEGRTGHDYDNRWEGDTFRWYHKAGSRLHWPSVAKLLEEGRAIHLFWRTSNAAPFEYAGLARAIEAFDTTQWKYCGRSETTLTMDPSFADRMNSDYTTIKKGSATGYA